MKKLIALSIAAAPSLAFAQAQIVDSTTLVQKFTSLGNTFIQVLIAFAVIWIIFNVIRFIVKADSDDRKTYQNAILWGIVGLFVILSLWGLVRILTNTFKTENVGPRPGEIPSIQYQP